MQEQPLFRSGHLGIGEFRLEGLFRRIGCLLSIILKGFNSVADEVIDVHRWLDTVQNYPIAWSPMVNRHVARLKGEVLKYTAQKIRVGRSTNAIYPTDLAS
jgi:hypothetical protein